jgi:sec-independent protein translocase protein TatC
MRQLDVLSIAESVWNSVHLATMAALVLTLPIFLYQLWRFIAVGLHDNERALGFLLLPMGVIFFYCGGLFGYLVGIPYAIAWFIAWSAADPIVHEIRFRMTDYQSTFFNWTLIFGGLLDIPWVIMVLVRVRVVTVGFLARQRRFAILGAVVLAGALAPDAMSMAIVAPPIYALFEIGLLFAWLIDWELRRKARAVANREDAG